MPVDFQTCLDRDLVYMQWTGVVDFDLVMGALAALNADVNFRADRPRLVDASGITDVDIDYPHLRSIVREKASDGGAYCVKHSASVIYAPGDTVFGVTRMVKTMTELAGGSRIDVFREEGEALEALGLDHPSIASLLEGEEFLPAKRRAGERLISSYR